MRAVGPQRPGSVQNNQNIAARFDEQARLRPHAQAILFPAGTDRFGHTTWSQLTFRQATPSATSMPAG